MPDDLTIVAQYAKSNRDTPSEVYNAACRVLDSPDARQVHAGHLIRLHGQAMKRAENLETAAQRAFKKLHSLHLFGSSGQKFTDTIHREVLAILSDALNGAESHGDGRTSQTLGTAGQEGAREAQEARE